MGFLGSLFGTTPNTGLNFQAQSGNPQNYIAPSDVTNAQVGAQAGVNNSNALAAQLAAQNGINNQSNVYNQQQTLASQLAGQNAVGNQNQLVSQEQALASGQGPNPALSQLAATTGQNIQQAAGTVASTKGLNPALAARLAGQQATSANQTANNQAATLAAQQQIAAQQNLSNTLQSQVGNLQNQQNALAGLSTTQVGQQQTATQNATNNAQNLYGTQLGAIGQQNSAGIQNAAQQNNANATIQGSAAQGQQATLGGILGGVGTGVSALLANKGGMVPHYDNGGVVAPSVDKPTIGSVFSKYLQSTQQNNPQATGASLLNSGVNNLTSSIATGVKNIFSPSSKASPVNPNASDDTWSQYAHNNTGVQTSQDWGQAMGAPMSRGGRVKAMVSPGEIYLPPKKAQEVAKGKASPMSGEKIPGKAPVKGDSIKNDTVPKNLEAGGIVIPRSVLQSDNPLQSALKFVHDTMTKGKR